jgi:Ala-tRNA(Pro) deacylase
MAVAITLQQYLEDQGVEYEVLVHSHTVSASRTAQKSHVPGDQVAKAVVLKSDEGFLVAVLPASRHVDLGQLRGWLDRPVGLATESEASALFPDCALGAVPPLGAAYGVEAILDDDLAAQPEVYFEGGDHASLIHVTAAQFRDLMAGARRGQFSRHD